MRLLNARPLIALYSLRSDRFFCEMLDYNIPFRRFLAISLQEPPVRCLPCHARSKEFRRQPERMAIGKAIGQDALVGTTSCE